MPIFDLQCRKCQKITEHFLWYAKDRKFCPDCGIPLKIVFSSCRIKLLNRSKPTSFKFDVKENDAHKDMIHHFKRQEEQGGPKSAEEKKDVDYWHSVLKDKL